MGLIIAHPVLLRQPDNLRRQHQNRRQIRHRHQSVQDLRRRPDRPGLQENRQQHRKALENSKQSPIDPAEQVFRAPPRIEPPSKDRRQSKERQAAAQPHSDPATQAPAQRRCGQLRPGMAPIGDPHAPGQDHHRRHGADHHGVEKHLHDPHKPLLRRMDTFRRAVGDGCRAYSRLVGECPPADPDPKGQRGTSHRAAGHCGWFKSAPQDRIQG